ncbi:MAG: putative metal-binding motif-containing protein [Myxococcota bacterium]
MLSIVIAAALAAGPENGDFEAGLAPWVDGSGLGGSASIAVEGTDFGDYSDPSGLNFPSPPNALLLKGGDGGLFTPAAAESAPLVVTNEDLSFRHRSEDSDIAHELRVREGSVIVLTAPFQPDASGSFDSETVDVSGLCGSRVTLQFVQYSTDVLIHRFTLVDDVVAEGALCADYVDGDDDGFCVHGVDLDDDGRCDGANEAEPDSMPVRDCADDDDGRFPGNPEIVDDGIDQDCDGFDPTGDCYEDADGDGYGDTQISGSALCDQVGEAQVPGDCDDSDPDIAPGAMELPADGTDSDCDGTELCFVDGDGDGFGEGTAIGSLACTQPGESTNGNDCDDSRDDAYPGAPELCNSLDDDCDGAADPDPASMAWPDADGDGFGDASSAPIEVCSAVSGVAANDSDCDDTDDEISPAATEIPSDGVDQDCSGDELCFADNDNDLYAGTSTAVGPVGCAGFPVNGGDCNDSNSQVNPGRPEVCDAIDNNCNGMLDEGLNVQGWVLDLDDDGYGDPSSLVEACVQPSPEYILVSGDCDDSDPDVNPGATEIPVDGLDSDCDGGDVCYADNDQDGFGGLGTIDSEDTDCADPGESPNDDDCNDGNADVNPDAVEIPGNSRDENCDGIDGPRDTADTGGPGALDPDAFVYRGGTSCSVTSGPSGVLLAVLPLLPLFRRRSP